MKVLTLKRAAGRITFAPDQVLDIPDELAQELIDCGAVRSVEPKQPQKIEHSEQKPQRKRKG